MGRKPRIDSKDRWHHVMNRAVAKRAMFESDSDVDRLVQRLEIAAERCALEIHAYAVLQSHFHLLVRSREGQLSRALHLIQAPFAQWFNRTRKRDGPIHRGRFLSIPVDSLRYRRFLIRYIDSNPVEAGLSTSPAEYPHCSASKYTRREGPTWMTRDWVESEVCIRTQSERYVPELYSTVFPPRVSREEHEFLSLDPRGGACLAQSADFLLDASIEEWDLWIADRARHADGIARLVRLVRIEAVNGWIQSRAVPEDRTLHPRSKQTRRNLLHATLARLCSGATIDEVARALRLSRPTTLEICREGTRRIQSDPEFAAEVAASSKELFLLAWPSL